MNTRILPIALLTASIAIGTGCATKKHVQATVTPLQQRIEQLENKSKDTEKSIAGLETGVNRADERARGADARAGQAATEAARASERATASGERADAAAKQAATAQQDASTVAKRASEIDTRVGGLIQGLDDYSKVAEGQVTFAVNGSVLSPEAKQELDTIAAKMQTLKRFVVEVQGYTDQTGGSDFNLALSNKRAQAVVHYLTVQHKVPLHRVHLIGVGEDAPVADNKTRDGRKQNRRVEIRILSADEALTGKKAQG